MCMCVHMHRRKGNSVTMSLEGKAGRNSWLSTVQMPTAQLDTPHILTVSGEKQALSRAQSVLSSETNHVFKRLFLSIISKGA